MCRVPCAVRPASATRSPAGSRSASRRPGPAESASSTPRRSTTITRAPSSRRRPASRARRSCARAAERARGAGGDDVRLSGGLRAHLGVDAAPRLQRERHLERDHDQQAARTRRPASRRAGGSCRSSSGEAKRNPTPRTVWMKRGSPGSSPSLRAQPADVHVERLRRAEPVRVPDLVDQPLARARPCRRRCISSASRSNSLRRQLELVAVERRARASPGRARSSPISIGFAGCVAAAARLGARAARRGCARPPRAPLNGLTT